MMLGPLILFLLIAFAMVVALIDPRTRPWALGLMLLVAVGIGVSVAIYQLRERGAPLAISQVDGVSAPSGPTIYPVIAFGWLPLVALLILIGFAVNKESRRHLGKAAVWTLFGFGALAALALFAPPRHYYSKMQATQFATSSSSNNQRTMALADHTIPAPPTAPALAANTETKPKAQSESANDTKSAPDQPSKRATADWAYDQSSKDVNSVNVDSGVYSDSAVRDQMLDVKMVAAANRYIDEVLYHQSGVADAVGLDAEFVRNFVRGQTTSPGNDQTSVRLEFNQHFRAEVDRRYRQSVSLGRMAEMGIYALGGIAVLAGLYSYLRVTQPRRSEAAKPVQTVA